jgi:hypothetical protein
MKTATEHDPVNLVLAEEGPPLQAFTDKNYEVPASK